MADLALNQSHIIFVGGAVFKNGKILIGKRGLEESHEPGKWALPGGKVDQTTGGFEHILEKKRTIITNYISLLQPLLQSNKVKVLESEIGTQASNWMFILMIPNVEYSKLENIFNIKNIQIRPLFYDIYKHSHLTSIKKTHDESKDSIINNGCMLPSYPSLTFNEQEYIISVLRDFLE